MEILAEYLAGIARFGGHAERTKLKTLRLLQQFATFLVFQLANLQ